MLEVKGLSLRLGKTDVLRELSFTVERGEFVAILGPNGAGKSSLLRCIDRIYTGYTGTITLNGTPTRTMPQRKLARSVSYVPQLVAEQLNLSVNDFMLLSRYPWKSLLSPKNDADLLAVDSAMNLCGLVAMKERSISSLSGGECQKVMFAAALSQGADLMLLDEPTTYLDYRHQIEILDLIRKVHSERRVTLIVVTHDLNFALQSSERVIVLADGQIAWDGKSDALANGTLLERFFEADFLRFRADGGSIPFVFPAVFARSCGAAVQ